jgi:hypothetical protein
MMGGEAFILLKAGLSGPETAKHTEIDLAGLLKILAIGLAMAKKSSQWAPRKCIGRTDGISVGYG